MRWIAEIVHPDRLQPKLREMLRNHFVKDFGYRLSDDKIDILLNIDKNKNQPGYARFTRGSSVSDQYPILRNFSLVSDYF